MEKAAQHVLDVRKKYPTSSLAGLYDPLTMPGDLSKAHTALDRAVDKTYRAEPFAHDNARTEFLFGLHEKLTQPLLPLAAKAKRAPKS